MTTTDLRVPVGTSVVVVASDELASSALRALLTGAGVTVTGDSRQLPPGAIAVALDADESTTRSVAETGLRAVMITDSEPDAEAVIDSVLKGTCAFLGSACSLDELLQAIEAVASNQSGLSPRQTRIVLDALRQQGRTTLSVTLTSRERQILHAIAEGESVKQTARRLGISPRTIDNTQRVMFLKLGVRNRAHAVARAHELGLLEAENG